MTQFYQLIRSHINELDAGTGVGTDKNKLNVLDMKQRDSFSAWLVGDELEQVPVVARLNRRFGALVGLEVGTSEPLQVLYYPTGGYITPHYDWGYVSTLPLLNFPGLILIRIIYYSVNSTTTMCSYLQYV